MTNDKRFMLNKHLALRYMQIVKTCISISFLALRRWRKKNRYSALNEKPQINILIVNINPCDVHF